MKGFGFFKGEEQPCYVVVNFPPDYDQPSERQLQYDLENGSISTKTAALKKVIFMIVNGEKLPGLLMTIIRFCLPLQDHTIKKLLLIYWEIVPKTSADGSLLSQMILVCDAYRKDLQHPNEFIRGSTLRFLCKLREPELLEPLMIVIRTCLEHKHPYVRRNAVLAIFTIYKNFSHLIPDAPELISKFLSQERDAACRRNGFLMLLHVDQKRALDYLSTVLDEIEDFGDILQLVIVELVYKVCHHSPSEKSKFIRPIYNLLSSNSFAVRYEAAGTLVTLSSAPSAIKAAASTYIDVIVKESDNNIKLIVLEKLTLLNQTFINEKVLEDLVMDILRILTASDMEIRRSAANLALELLTSRHIGEVVLFLRKEVSKTNNSVEFDDSGPYRQLLVRSLHQCCMKFPDAAPSVIPVLSQFLSDRNESVGANVLLFLREVIEKFSGLGRIVVENLLQVFPHIKCSNIIRASIWILGEFATRSEDMKAVLGKIKAGLGDLPLVESELKKRRKTDEVRESGDFTKGANDEINSHSSSCITSDGTYATQSAFSIVHTPNIQLVPQLRKLLFEGDFFLGVSLSACMTKITLRLCEKVDKCEMHRIVALSMFIMSSIIRLGKCDLVKTPITADDVDRISLCLRVLCEEREKFSTIFTKCCRLALGKMLKEQSDFEAERLRVKGKIKKNIGVEADDRIPFVQLMSINENMGGDDVFEVSLSQAIGLCKETDPDFSSSKLSKISQLSGYSDPIYAEAFINVNQFDIVLDVLLVNQTPDTLQNVTLELAALGDLKLVERPQPIILGPHGFSNIRASIKVSSTENGVIFGNIVYSISGVASDPNIIVINDIHIDIMDYIFPTTCTEQQFRTMWSEFEWENKISVHTTITDLHLYLLALVKSTNMQCLTPEKALTGNCGFMAVTLYAKSIFGEDALANLSIEKPMDNPQAPVTGHIKIRAKSQGMALSLGEKINNSQKRGLSNLPGISTTSAFATANKVTAVKN